MLTYTFVYDKNKTKDIVLKSISAREESAYTDIQVFQRCCGSIAYASLFMLPEFDLADKSTYSVERVCVSTPRMFKYDMRTLLCSLGKIACEECTADALSAILSLPTLYECLNFLGVSVINWTRIFLNHYLRKTGIIVSDDYLLQFTTYDKLMTIFYGEEV